MVRTLAKISPIVLLAENGNNLHRPKRLSFVNNFLKAFRLHVAYAKIIKNCFRAELISICCSKANSQVAKSNWNEILLVNCE